MLSFAAWSQPASSNRPYYHTRRRVWERYGFTLTRAAYRQVCQDIQAGCYPVEDEAHCGRLVYRVELRGRRVLVVWCPRTQIIVTALPLRGQGRWK